jgi:aminodeoxychorismate lyase
MEGQAVTQRLMLMTVCLNGNFVPDDQAVVSVFDRGFLYGDGLFETVRVFNSRPFRWQQHMERLEHGAEFINVRLPFSASQLREFAERLVSLNRMPDGLLRLALSRGIGLRGYSPKGVQSPTLVMSVHPSSLGSSAARPGLADERQGPLRWRLVTSSFRLPANEPLAQFKTANKLPQILARAQADDSQADEALLLNTDGWVVEGSCSNLFWIANGQVVTPPLAGGILAGVTRAVVCELCAGFSLTVCERNIRPDQLKLSDGVFLTLSSFGIVEAQSLDGHELKVSPLTAKLRAAYGDLFRRETA